MAEILHHQRCINPVNNGIFIISTGQPSTVWLWGHICLEVILRLMTPHQADWWLEEHGLIMEKPDPLPPGTWASNVISFNYSSFLGRFFSWVFAGGWHTHTHTKPWVVRLSSSIGVFSFPVVACLTRYVLQYHVLIIFMFVLYSLMLWCHQHRHHHH